MRKVILAWFGFFLIAPVWSRPAAIPDGLYVGSLNLARNTNVDKIAATLAHEQSLQKNDILLFQEVAAGDGSLDVAQKVGKKLGYFTVAVQSDPLAPNQGLAILSRYPLRDLKILPLKHHNLKFRSRIRFAIAATAQTPLGPVRIWNAHLDTRINPSERVEQITPILEDARNYNGLRLVGGDFNTTKFHWVFNLIPVRFGEGQVNGLTAAFEQSGFDTPFGNKQTTFHFLRQHLDWVFSSGLVPEYSGVTDVAFSDHYAIWACFRPSELDDLSSLLR